MCNNSAKIIKMQVVDTNLANKVQSLPLLIISMFVNKCAFLWLTVAQDLCVSGTHNLITIVSKNHKLVHYLYSKCC